MKMYPRSMAERATHAMLFEIISILLTAPISAWLLDKSIWDIGIVAIILSTIAMVLNIVYNMGFDKICPPTQAPRSFKIRAMHALGFELSFIIISVPVVALSLSISLLAAFIMDVGLLIFYLFYTFGFNWLYDYVRSKLIEDNVFAHNA